MPKHKIFLISLLCFIASVAAASFFELPTNLLFVGLLLGLFWVTFFVLKKSPKAWYGFFLLVVILGIWRFQAKAQEPVLPISESQRVEAVFTGIVSNYPDERLDKTYLVLSQIEFADSNSNSYSNVLKNIRVRSADSAIVSSVKVRITISRYPEYRYGDKLLIRGKISRPENFADFDYRNYLAKDNIYLVSSFPQVQLLERNKGNWLKQKLFAIRERFSNSLRSAIKEPQAAFAEGLLLGMQSRMPQEVQNSFRVVGLSHVVALSGFNIMIIARALVVLLLFLTLRRELSFWLALGGIAAFVVLTGAEASVVRAAVMGILVLVAKREGRLYNIKNALAFAAAVMIWFNPKVLRFDVGFQLSFLATLGLVYLSPRLQTLLEKMPKLWTIKEYLIATVSAQFAVLPLILYQFEQFSTIAPLANILVLPLIPFIMGVSFIAGLLNLILPILGTIAGLGAEILLNWPLWLSEKLAQLPAASFNLGFGLIFAIVYGVVLYLWLKVEADQRG